VISLSTDQQIRYSPDRSVFLDNLGYACPVSGVVAKLTVIHCSRWRIGVSLLEARR
jgi:hypothetical protein